jgi:succinate dehydrogenase/fumarate reductase flavoprotein subunit
MVGWNSPEFLPLMPALGSALPGPSESLSPDLAEARRIDFRNHREMLEANLARQIEAIRAADIKIALLVPTTTAMMGVLAALLRDWVPGRGETVWVVLTVLPLFFAFAMMAAGVIPRLRGNPSRSLLFFGDLSAHGAAEAQSALLSVSPQAYLADLAAQCHATASIARTKHQTVRRAYLAFLLALPFWLGTIWVLNGG